MNLAPVLIFTYNRIHHIKETIEKLSLNDLAKDSEIFIYSDGPKNIYDTENVEIVRKYLKKINYFKSITLIFREKNYGLSKNIIEGVTEICNKYGKVIVLEDDLVTSPFFLTFMNEAIEKYKTNPNVSSIHGYVYPTNIELPETFFIKGADCWGWATWTSSWKTFEKNGKILLNEIIKRKLTKEFNFNNTFDYVQMLEDQINGNNNSWAIRWHASCFLNNMYTLYPGKSLVSNIGFDNSGTHSGQTKIFEQRNYNQKIIIKDLLVENNQIAYKAFQNYFKRNKFYKSFFKKLIIKILPSKLFFFIIKYK